MAQNQPTANASESVRLGGFEILDKIAEGGMGTVYRARQTSLNRIVAVKFLNPRLAADTEYIESFRREAQAAARLQHPNIVSVIDAGEDGGLYFYAMEIVGGKTLYRWVQRDGALTEPTVLGIGVCVASALKHAWDKERLIHRDLKPDNVMVDPDGNVKLCDLGLAKTVGEHTASDGHVFGTPHYMSPEQARAQAVDFRTDIYSLGMTLYYALTAQVPFHGGDAAKVIKRHLQGQLPDPRQFAPKTSLQLCRVLEKMTAKPLAERYQSWDDVLRDFELVRNLQPPRCAPPSPANSAIRISEHILQPTRPLSAAVLIPTPGHTAAPPPQPAAPAAKPRSSLNLPLLVAGVALAVGALGVIIALLLNPRAEAPQPLPPTPAPSAAQRWEEAIAFARANENHRNALPEFADRLRKIIQDFPNTPEASQAQMLLNFLTAQPQAALNAQQNNPDNPPNAAFVPNIQWQPPQEPPWMRFVRPFINNAEQWANWAQNMAQQWNKAPPPDIAKPPDPSQIDEKSRRTFEQRLKEENARAKAAAEFDARFAKAYLAVLSKRDYQAAVDLARNAAGDPAFNPLRDDLKVAEDGAKRLRQFWKSLPPLANSLKGRVVPFRGQLAKLVGADKNEIVFETQPNVSFGISYDSLTTAEIAALALLATPNPTADTALDGAWFLFAEGRMLDASQMLDAAQRVGADTAPARRLMGMLARGAMETEADAALKQLRAASEQQRWDDARVKLAVLNERYSKTKTAQTAAAQIKELETRVKTNSAPKLSQ